MEPVSAESFFITDLTLSVKKMPCRKIYIEAQSYAVGYYEREGFKVTSAEFLEDGIPHVQMELDFEQGKDVKNDNFR